MWFIRIDWGSWRAGWTFSETRRPRLPWSTSGRLDRWRGGIDIYSLFCSVKPPTLSIILNHSFWLGIFWTSFKLYNYLEWLSINRRWLSPPSPISTSSKTLLRKYSQRSSHRPGICTSSEGLSTRCHTWPEIRTTNSTTSSSGGWCLWTKNYRRFRRAT